MPVRVFAVAAVVLLAVYGIYAVRGLAGGGGAAVVESPSGTPAAAPSTPDETPADEPDGELGESGYQIRAAHSDLCLGEGPEPGNPERIVIVQADCAGAEPPISLKPLGDGMFQILLHSPEFGLGCLRVDGESAGALYAGSDCGDEPRQSYTITPVTGDAYRIGSPGDVCMGILDGSADPGVAAISGGCTDEPSRLFTFHAVQGEEKT